MKLVCIALGLMFLIISIRITKGAEILKALGLSRDSQSVLKLAISIAIMAFALIFFGQPTKPVLHSLAFSVVP